MQYLERRHEYLADPERGINKTQVFVRQLVQPGTYWRGEYALRTLRTRALSGPISIRKVSNGEGMTVVLRASDMPFIEFGYSAPQGDEQGELKEIRRIMRAHGLRTTLQH